MLVPMCVVSSAEELADKPYYTEVILHTMMLDPDPFGGYIIHQEIIGAGNVEDPDYLFTMEMACDVLKEMNRLMGKADRKPIYTPSDWSSAFILSGMYADGMNYRRVTPDTSVKSLENFKSGDTDPTFYVAGKTITFPGGKIIQDGYVRGVGRNGYISGPFSEKSKKLRQK